MSALSREKNVAASILATCITGGVIASIGIYDGVPLCQRRVLDLVNARATEPCLLAAVGTFVPDRLTVILPDLEIKLLTTLAQ